MQVHALIAAFIFPVATMFLITGALYTWGIKGSYQDDVHEIRLDQPLERELGKLTGLAEAQLERLDLAPPSGNPKLKKYGPHFLLEWTGSSRDVVLEPTDDALVARLTVKHTTWYRHLVQLHKAKGGEVFKVYAAVLAISLATLLVTGFMLALQTPKLKQATIVTFFAGLGSFFAMLWLS